VTCSLGSACVMTFSQGDKKVDKFLKRRSLVVMSGDSRYKWTHAIAGRKTDKYVGATLRRERRVSVTFRQLQM